MVVISIKRSGADGDGFLYETTTDTSNEQLIESLVTMQNLRLRSKLVVDSVRGLVQYGPMKDPNPDPNGDGDGDGDTGGDTCEGDHTSASGDTSDSGVIDIDQVRSLLSRLLLLSSILRHTYDIFIRQNLIFIFLLHSRSSIQSYNSSFALFFKL